MVAVNLFDGKLRHEIDDIRWALAIADNTPLITFDARERGSVRDALLAVLDRSLADAEAATRAAEAATRAAEAGAST